jgi:hypothetical protein
MGFNISNFIPFNDQLNALVEKWGTKFFVCLASIGTIGYGVWQTLTTLNLPPIMATVVLVAGIIAIAVVAVQYFSARREQERSLHELALAQTNNSGTPPEKPIVP